VRDVTLCPAVLTAAEIAVNPFAVRGSTARFMAFYNDEFDSADIELRQINYHIVPAVKSYYVLGGGVHSFTVRSNTGWEVNHVDDDIGVDISSQSGGYNTTTGQTVNFQLAHDNTKDEQIAKIILVDPTNRAGNVEVPVRGVACGLDAIAYGKTIGSNSYGTHAYGTGADQRCWMVENSMEGTYSGRAFGRDANRNRIGSLGSNFVNFDNNENGYYYTYTQAMADNNACPTGWRLFTTAEASTLAITANTPGLKATVGKWWTLKANNALAGGFYTSVNPGYPNLWGEWGTFGFWWGSELDMNYNGNTNSVNATAIYKINEAWYWFTVRCVQD
jgi:uncharacterized protein (TIGR02145 family)